LPKSSDTYYLLTHAQQFAAQKADVANLPVDSDDVSIIFCLDISGSMDTIVEDKCSRLELVKEAIRAQVDEMVKSNPLRKAGLVLFGSNVIIIGDGFGQETSSTAGVDDWDKIRSFAQKTSSTHLTKNVSESREHLMTKLVNATTSGTTALGPALLTGLGLAMQGKPGSQVILCTDGLANVGLGKLGRSEDESSARAFYDRIGTLAQEIGVSVSIITIKGCGAKVEILGRACSLSGGLITNVDPAKIEGDFGKMMKDEIVGTNVEIEIHLHHGLKFTQEDPQHLRDDGSVFFRKVGNVTRLSEFGYEYMQKSEEELAKAKADLSKIDKIPFQAQITFTTKDGNRYVRVVTIQQNVTDQEEKVWEDVNAELIAKNGMQQAAKLAKKGLLAEAKAKCFDSADFVANYQMKNAGNVSEALSNLAKHQGKQSEQIQALSRKEEKGAKAVSREEEDEAWAGLFADDLGKFD
jgi:Mg-chelatase subunit ChlD